MSEEIIKQAPVRIKLEEGAKGEIKATVSIDGESELEVIPRILKAFKDLKEGVS
jgi:hypothetical protein